MGFVGDAIGSVFGGIADLLGVTPKVETSAAQDVEEDRKKNSKKRKALYTTKGGVLGQEVDEVSENSRGNLFGN